MCIRDRDNVEKALGISKSNILKSGDTATTLRMQSPETARGSQSYSLRNSASGSSSFNASGRGNSPARYRQLGDVRRDSFDAAPRTSDAYSMGAARTAPAETRPDRKAHFEAPIPARPNPAARSNATQYSKPAPNMSSNDSTKQGASGRPDVQFTSSQRKHLPQERRAVSGSIPQWSGFPGQKELF